MTFYKNFHQLVICISPYVYFANTMYLIHKKKKDVIESEASSKGKLPKVTNYAFILYVT